jgi:hypothetical protein
MAKSKTSTKKKPAAKAKKKSIAKPKKRAIAKPKVAKAKAKASAAAKPKVAKRKVAAKKKAAAKPKVAAKKKSSAKAKPMRREDRPGHYDPKYKAKLRQLGQHEKDDDRAFVGGARTRDDLAEELGEEAVVAMTSGEDGLGDDLQADVPEDSGGPFVRSSGGKEFADGTDASNPDDALREPFPKT